MSELSQSSIAQHYDKLATRRDGFRQKNHYFYQLLFNQYKYFIPKGKKVLEIGCSTGDLLNAVEPAYGLGIDVSQTSIDIAKEKYAHLDFQAVNVSSMDTNETFDYIILSGVLGEAENIQELLMSLKKYCRRDTRIIIEYYSYLWQMILKVGESIGSKIPQRIQNWITFSDLKNFLTLSGFETVKKERMILFPRYIWGLSYLLNRFIAKLPIINELTLCHFAVVRPIIENTAEHSVTILVPCRNEKGNIESAITRTPNFGSHQEFIFVEGGSKDGTYEEVERIIEKYKDHDIKLFKQKGIGKGDAVREGYSHATSDILMILDADLTVAPEDLPLFYEAIRSNKGEFINGCRLVYPMEKEAMRFLNLIANKFFGILFSWLLGQRFKDTLCGTKVMFRSDYEDLAANRHYFGDFDPFGDYDLIFGATKLNLKILELPIRYHSRSYGETQIQRFRHGLLLIRMCVFAMKKIKFI